MTLIIATENYCWNGYAFAALLMQVLISTLSLSLPIDTQLYTADGQAHSPSPH